MRDLVFVGKDDVSSFLTKYRLPVQFRTVSQREQLSKEEKRDAAGEASKVLLDNE